MQDSINQLTVPGSKGTEIHLVCVLHTDSRSKFTNIPEQALLHEVINMHAL